MSEVLERPSRKSLSALGGGPAARMGLGVLLTILLGALCADFLAAALPVAMRLDGEIYLLPNLTHPAELRADDNQSLAPRLREGDWAVFPLVPWGQNAHDLDAILEPPSAAHWFGTDSSGRDVFARVVHGARVSLTVAVSSVLLISCIGLCVGLCAGYFGGWVDACLMRAVDALHAVPTTLLLVTLLQVSRPTGFAAVLAVILVIGCVRWTDLSRMVRAEVLRVRETAYVEAARSLGLSSTRILRRHVLPNVLSPVLVAASFELAAAIIIEGALSFLGFGVPDDVASWGALLGQVRQHSDAWWLAAFPGVMLFVSVGVFNVLGEALRVSIDPRRSSWISVGPERSGYAPPTRS